MFAVFFLAGVIVSGALAYSGLVRGQLQLSKSKTITGTGAKIIGSLCALFALTLVGGVVWGVLQMMKG
jgi:hypothetical protein